MLLKSAEIMCINILGKIMSKKSLGAYILISSTALGTKGSLEQKPYTKFKLGFMPCALRKRVTKLQCHFVLCHCFPDMFLINIWLIINSTISTVFL